MREIERKEKDKTAGLNNILKEFEKQKAITRELLAEKEKLAMEREMTDKEKMVLTLEKERIANDRKHLYSQQITLKNAFEEARRKRI